MKNENNFTILLIEKDQLIIELIKKYIISHTKIQSLSIESISDPDHVFNIFKKHHSKPNLIILSEPVQHIQFSKEIPSRIQQIKKVSPDTEVLIISNPLNVEQVLYTFRSGAFDLIIKDEHTNKNILNAIHRLYLRQQDCLKDNGSKDWVIAN